MTDKEYIQRNAPTREQRRQRDIRRNLVILGVALAVLAALLFLLGAGAAEELEAPAADKPAVASVAPVNVPTIQLAPATATEPPTTPAPHYPMTDEERDLVERVVHAESGNQSLTGQIAVALCILNTAVMRDMRPDEVVLEKNQYAGPSDKEEVTESVREAVELVFDSGQKVTDEPIRFFYAPKYSEGRFHNSAACEFVVEIGGHRFYKEAGT